VRERLVVLVAVVALLAWAAPSSACMHLPASYEGSVTQRAQSAVVLWHDGREELILRAQVAVRGKEPPAELAWVIPVPNVPDAYGVEDPALFQAIYDTFERTAYKQLTLGARSSGEPAPLELLQTASVGEYEIQPIRARGPEGAAALNAWLERYGFGAVDAANMAWYVDRGWTWLAVRARPDEAPDGEVRPLRISFASERIVYPLKFSTHQGVFDLSVWIVTAAPLQGFQPDLRFGYVPQEDHPLQALGLRPPTDGSSLLKIRLIKHWAQGYWMELPPEARRVVESAVDGGTFPGFERELVHVTQLRANQVNHLNNPIAGWPLDVELDAGPDVDPDDQALSAWEEVAPGLRAEWQAREEERARLAREQRVRWGAAGGGAALLLGGVLLLRRRRRGRLERADPSASEPVKEP
jgi:Uncharacterized protein conserved in bacteria (DUF2330)